MNSELSFALNGNKVTAKPESVKTTLLEYLRSPAVNLMGTKYSCGQGGCGACTVIKVVKNGPHSEARQINSCLTPLCSIDGTNIITIEGLTKDTRLLKSKAGCVQTSIKDHNGSQCGYCTPGFTVNMYALLNNNSELTDQDIENSFGGNLCRCTGYAKILKAMKEVKDVECKINSDKLPDTVATPGLNLTIDGYKWVRPDSYHALEKLITESKQVDVKFVNGNTSVGIYDDKVYDPKFFIDISRITEIKTIQLENGKLSMGAGATYSDLIHFINERINVKGEYVDNLLVIRKHMEGIAGMQVRNLGSIGGAVAMVKQFNSLRSPDASYEPFPSDFIITALTFSGTIDYLNGAGQIIEGQSIEAFLNDNTETCFFIKSITLDVSQSFSRTYRVARRQQNAHAIVNAGFALTHQNEIITKGKIVFGAIGTLPSTAERTSRYLINKKGSEIDLNILFDTIEQDLNGFSYFNKKTEITQAYKLILAKGLFTRYILEFLNKEFKIDVTRFAGYEGLSRKVSEITESYIEALYYEIPEGIQPEFVPHKTISKMVKPKTRDIFIDAKDGEYSGLPKVEMEIQTNGTAIYTYDMHGPQDTLHAVYIYSEIASGTFSYSNGYPSFIEDLKKDSPLAHYISFLEILNIDAIEQNHDFFSRGNYDPVFSEYNSKLNEGYISSYGQPIGLLVAPSIRKARELALVAKSRIVFKSNEEEIVQFNHANLPERRLMKMFPGALQHVRRYNDDSVVSDKWLDGEIETDYNPRKTDNEVEIAGWQNVCPQIHFYMEPNVTLAIPDDNGGLILYSSSQFLTNIQKHVCDLLNLPNNQVSVRTKRLGGGFGGKELRPRFYAGAAAVAAFKLKKPVRLALDRDTDSIMNGTRHPMSARYKLIGDLTGKIEKLRIDFHSNIGNSWDCSYPVMELVLLSADSVYNVEKFRANGFNYLTNVQSRTAFRSFGLIQAAILCEEPMEQYAHEINVPSERIRTLNFYSDATIDKFDTTPFGQPLQYCRINQVWEDLKKKANYDTRVKAVEQFNKVNKLKKRGISIIPIKYGISYTYRPMNFGNAYLFVYAADASILIHHGGIEMGQGIHTKIIELASKELFLDVKCFRIDESATDKIPNASSTGASTGSDLNGAAVVNACRELRTRMIKFLKEHTVKDQTPEQFELDDALKNESFKSVYDKIRDSYRLTPDEDLFKNFIFVTEWKAAWKSLITYAAACRINLSAEGYYQSPGFGFLDGTNGRLHTNSEKRIFYYFTYSAAISEVEIDVLTGEFNILQTDLAYDAGVSLNEKIDSGQIQGGFIQGVGYVTTENVHYDEKGKLITTNTWEYKIPCTKTIPEKFNIHLLKYKPTNDQTQAPLETYGIQSSKSAGEPPLVLASSVFFAIKSAIMDARKDRGQTQWVHIDAPLTVQKICMYANCKQQ